MPRGCAFRAAPQDSSPSTRRVLESALHTPARMVDVSVSTSSLPPARYFVVQPGPLEMVPGLFRLGQAFGNGPRDALTFQRDLRLEDYRNLKQRVLERHPDRISYATDARAQDVIRHVTAWMWSRLGDEYDTDPFPTNGENTRDPRANLESLSLQLQEDFAIVSLDGHPNDARSADAMDRLVCLSVCFPSGWRPERLLGASFRQVHAPVPHFEKLHARHRQMVTAMVERGPYVRFVWSVTADDRLDHHPDHAPRDEWSDASCGFYRVERQVTVPFPEVRSSLFLIRTYLVPFVDLSEGERSTLSEALRRMPKAIQEYKGLAGSVDIILPRLASDLLTPR